MLLSRTAFSGQSDPIHVDVQSTDVVSCMKLLLVEDSQILQRSLSMGLSKLGMTVDQAFDGEEAERFLQFEPYDVVILDLMLPKLSGLDVLKRMRKRGNRTFVLILSAKDEIEDRTRGLDLGADDYLIKPFSFDELISRLRALKRRIGDGAPSLDTVIMIEEVSIDTLNRTVSIKDTVLELTPSEYRIIELLATRRRQTYSHDQLIDKLYRADQCVTRNAIEAHVSTLRRKLRVGGQVDLVKTRRGFGYYID